MDEKVLMAIRLGHVEQAKSHLKAALHTYYGNDATEDYPEVAEKIYEFIDWLDERAPGIC